MIAYISLITFLVTKTILWNSALIKDTIYWSIGSAFVLLINSDKANKDEKYFKKVLLETLTFALVLEFAINLYTFNLIAELVIVFVVTFIAMMIVLSKAKKEYKQLTRPLESILGVLGVYLLVLTVGNIVSDYQGFANSNNLQAFLLVPVLTVAYLPYIYFVALWIAYEDIFLRVNLRLKENQTLLRFAKRKIFILCLFNLRKLNRFSKQVVGKLWQISEKKDVTDLIQTFKSEITNS